VWRRQVQVWAQGGFAYPDPNPTGDLDADSNANPNADPNPDVEPDADPNADPDAADTGEPTQFTIKL